jgi:hypothetical protein
VIDPIRSTVLVSDFFPIKSRTERNRTAALVASDFDALTVIRLFRRTDFSTPNYQFFSDIFPIFRWVDHSKLKKKNSQGGRSFSPHPLKQYNFQRSRNFESRYSLPRDANALPGSTGSLRMVIHRASIVAAPSEIFFARKISLPFASAWFSHGVAPSQTVKRVNWRAVRVRQASRCRPRTRSQRFDFPSARSHKSENKGG